MKARGGGGGDQLGFDLGEGDPNGGHTPAAIEPTPPNASSPSASIPPTTNPALDSKSTSGTPSPETSALDASSRPSSPPPSSDVERESSATISLSDALPDSADRARIATDLATNLLVEAGAGSGKTTALVSRMVALVREGAARVTEIAAVTFTRKAAGELRERFQEALEKERTRESLDAQSRARLEAALHELDRAFMGTIHAFCARLLRERPIEAGIDPAFSETTATQAERLGGHFWTLHLERLAASGHAILGELEAVGISPVDLRGLYDQLCENLDVDFPLEASPLPDPAEVANVRVAVERILDSARPFTDAPEEQEWDELRGRLRSIGYVRRYRKWADDRVFLDALADLCSHKTWKIVQYRWSDEKVGKAAAKEIARLVNLLCEPDSQARRLLETWWAHRYEVSMRFALEGAHGLEAHRRSTGQLDFQDLLALSARLLRGSPEARRDLGRRWSRLLVDEFQDTDPLQAEVLFLLASDPESDDGDWTRATPRPGALFVVGDPKQSIYRFRRADIALYAQVRRRFAELGDVLSLVTNFRSGHAVAALVNSVFAPPFGFPDEGTDVQAAFAPLLPAPGRSTRPHEGVLHYEVRDAKSREDAAVWDASALAEWIRARTLSGQRQPGEFLILTRGKKELQVYARALEARELPVQVSGAGAGLGVEELVSELRLILESLLDPDDPSLAVAVLVGAFFGLDHEQLLRHVEAGRSFDFRRSGWGGSTHATRKRPVVEQSPSTHAASRFADMASAPAASVATPGVAREHETEGGDDPVESALSQLRTWWETLRVEPADVVVTRIAAELGLLAYAAAGDLGSIRAGALAFVLDAVRAAGSSGDTSLRGALEAIAQATEDEEIEAPLEPGRSDAIRLMNLHKAKGLEAPVVVLAAPYGEWDAPIDKHIERSADGRARGWLNVEKKDGQRYRVVAQPRGWRAKRDAEAQFRKAEAVRLLYVAATRAGDELVVARRAEQTNKSPWAPLDPWLLANGTVLDIAPVAAPARERLDSTAQEMGARIEAAAERRRAAAEPTFAFRSVTAVAKGEESGAREPLRPSEVLAASEPTRPNESPVPSEASPATASQDDVESSLFADSDDPPSIGSPPSPATGPVLADPADGPSGYAWGSAVHGVLEAAARGAKPDQIRAVARSLLLELERPVKNGEPIELDMLLDTARGVIDSPIWERSLASGRALAEVPFSIERPGEALPTYLEGVIDLAFHEEGGWVVVDYKTDRGDDPDFTARRERYRQQLRIYGEAWERLTGEPVKELLLWFVRSREIEAVERA